MTPQMLAHTVAMSSADPISACDPQGVAAALAFRRARLTEATLNAMIQKDAEDNEFANFWQLPDLQLFKYYNGRLAFLAEETEAWTRVPRDEFTRCVRFFLHLVQRPSQTHVLSWDVQPPVLVSFFQAIVTVKLPYEQIFTKPDKAWLHNNIIMRQIDTDKFPGPRSSAFGTGQSAFRWWHGCNEASLLGIFKSGRVFRTCNETVGVKPADTAYGFFGRAAYEGDDMVAAGLTSNLAFHSKNQCGVLVSGTLNCVHSQAPSASTFHEAQNLRDFELIKSPSKDKRWAIRESSAKVSRFYLLSPVHEANDEQLGPEWNELLTLEPAPAVVMDNDAVDPAQ
eukprot:s4253_g6.t1